MAIELTENEQLILSSSPHIRATDTVSAIMFRVLIALAPAAVMAIWHFGFRALVVMAVAIGAAVGTEYVFQKARGLEVTIWDGSALLTGLFLAFNVPIGLPLWMVIVGAVVAVGLGKQVFGGLGHNPFNPALVGRAFLLASFPVHMTTWLSPIDGTTSATPLALAKMTGDMTPLWQLFVGNVGGSLGETSAVALLLGAAYLLITKTIDWRIPLGYLGTVIVLALAFGENPGFHLLAGGLMLGAFFMATDMVTSPVTKKGRWIFGIGAGVILMVIRVWGGYPEGVSYSILLMNGITPLLNHYTKPRVFGEVTTNA